MITERELLDAIRECEAEPITPNKVSKLADFYTIYDHLFGMPYEAAYSYANQIEKTISVTGDSDFMKAVNGKDAEKVMAVVDELLEAVKVLQPRMYDGVLRRLSEI